MVKLNFKNLPGQVLFDDYSLTCTHMCLCIRAHTYLLMHTFFLCSYFYILCFCSLPFRLTYVTSGVFLMLETVRVKFL